MSEKIITKHFFFPESLGQNCGKAFYRGGHYTQQNMVLNKKHPGLNDCGNFQPVQIVKDAKILRFTIRKACSREKDEAVTRQPFANTSERSKGQSIQSHKKLFFKRLSM